MRVIGVDEHVWRYTPYGDRYVTVIVDVTPVRERRGPSRLWNMVPGRSRGVFTTWLASQPNTWRERIEIVAMDGFTGVKSTAAKELPGARAVMDPFHVVHLAGDALEQCRRRIGQERHHRRGRAMDPLYKARRMLHTRSCLLTPRQQHRILNLFASDCHVAPEVTWSVYQNIIDAYRAPDTSAGKAQMQAEIACLSDAGIPSSLKEIITLGRILKHRAEHSSKQEDSGPNYTPNYEEAQKMSQPWELPPVFALIRALELGYVNDHRRLSDNELHAARGADARPHAGAIPAAP